MALQTEGIYLEDKKVVMLGAGGSARAIAFYIASEAQELVILNRTESKAIELAESLKYKKEVNVKALKLNLDNLKMELNDKNIILINSTSVGMHPNENETLVTSDLLKNDMVVFDIVYNPIETRLLKEAKSAGAKAIDGVGMLVYQGAAAFELWTGKRAPADLMKSIVEKELLKREKRRRREKK